MSRVSGVNVDGTLLVRYAYLGSGQLARTAYPSIGLQHQLYDSANAYNRVDRFNRMTTVSWEEAATAYKAYDVTLAWDRGGNILSVDDKVHTGFDFLYSIDDLDRVTRAHRGTLSGGSISTPKQDQRWTLDHLGNWSQNRFDLNGDGDFTDAEELDELRDHNAVNEILDRDTNGDSTPEFTLAYDAVGQLTDDGEDYKYTWDAFGRMRKILKRSDDSLVEEIRYNGLGFMIGEHYDADEDLDVDSNDPWYFHAYDERWRQIATYRGADTSPKEEWVLHQAGLDGLGGSSYINAIALRDRDHNTAWTAASDGTREQRIFYSQNWRGDVVALTKSDGTQVEQVRYTAYGIPFGLPAGDLDSDGDCDATDETLLDGIIAASGYDVRGDLDTDGDCDSIDEAGLSLAHHGRGLLSSVGQRAGFEGGWSAIDNHLILLRHRVYSSRLGTFISRDPLVYVDGLSLYSYTILNPLTSSDPYGLSPFKCTIGLKTEDVIPAQWVDGTNLCFGYTFLYYECKAILYSLDDCIALCENAADRALANAEKKYHEAKKNCKAGGAFGAGGAFLTIVLGVSGPIGWFVWAGAAAAGGAVGLSSYKLCIAPHAAEYSAAVSANKDAKDACPENCATNPKIKGSDWVLVDTKYTKECNPIKIEW
jgi:RHS repeat-associated protein